MAASEAKVALVTGASSGIGEAVAKLLLRKGYKVAICGSQKEKVDRVIGESSHLSPHSFQIPLPGKPLGQPLGLTLDLGEPTNGRVAVEKTLEHFGRLDVLVNNAGTFARTAGDDRDSYAQYRRLMSVNMDASVSATLAAVEALEKCQGHVIFISSTASVKAHEKSYAYCASKAALTMFAKCLAIDLAQRIKVNVISPGPVVTDIFRQVGVSPETARVAMRETTLEGRAGEVDDITGVVEFLLSPAADFITGHELFVDGGYLLKPSTSGAANRLAPHVKRD